MLPEERAEHAAAVASWESGEAPADATEASRAAERARYARKQETWRENGGEHGGLIGAGKEWKKRTQSMALWKRAKSED